MAYLESRYGGYRVVFRYAGKQFKHKLGKVEVKEAEACLSRIEENLKLVDRGRLEVPADADPVMFLLSDERIAARPKVAEALTLATLRDGYIATQAERLEDNSLATVRIHFRHLVATYGESYDVRKLDLSDLERHLRRSAITGRGGRPLNAETTRKEIKALSGAWKWALHRGVLDRPFPSIGLVYSKTVERPPFRTRSEIEATLKRGSVGDSGAVAVHGGGW